MSNLILKPDTPNIAQLNPIALAECSKHGRQRWFVVCLCILKFSERVKHYWAPSADSAGEILCKKKGLFPPDGEGQHHKGELVMLCAQCARELGLIESGSVEPCE